MIDRVTAFLLGMAAGITITIVGVILITKLA